MSEAKTEWEVAKKAEKMLTESLRNATSGFVRHVTKNPSDKSIKDAKGKAKTKRYRKYTVEAGTHYVHYVRSIGIQMPRHGYIQHFGVYAERKGGTRTRHTPQETTYRFKTHVMQMDPQPFIGDAIDRSRMIPYVMENIARIRGEEILADIKSQFEEK